jgi:opacity protein-like surface antigen
MKIIFRLCIIFLIAQCIFVNSQIKNEKLPTVIFSIKPGFHTGYDKNSENGFNSGFLIGANAEVQLSENKYAGFFYEYWNHSDEEFHDIFGSYTRTYTGNNLSLCLIWRMKKKDFTPLIGAGFGFYLINTEYGAGRFKRTYFDIKIIAGFDLKINRSISISAEIAFNQLLKTNESPLPRLLSFKIGPSLILN